MHDFLFVDESHLLKAPAQDLLMEIIDDLSIMAPRLKKTQTNKEEMPPERIQIPACTIVLATDQPGALCNALRRRMADQVPLRLYRVDELKEIAEQIATSINVLLTPHAARYLADMAHGLTGTVKRYLDGIRLYFPNSETDQVGLPQVKEFLSKLGVDERGLGQEERQYLRYLDSVGSAGKESMALYLGPDVKFVRQQIEPILLRQGLIKIGKGGRQLTDLGKDVVKGMALEQEEKEDDHDGSNQKLVDPQSTLSGPVTQRSAQ